MSIDIDAVRKRARFPAPPMGMPFEGETPSEARDREIVNGWLLEWVRDKKDLLSALNELELLRKSQATELLALVKRLLDAKQTKTEVEQELRRLVGL
jgi:hypothetical protein